MRAFITGGTGFVGANLARLLCQEGYSVRALVRPHANLTNLAGLDLEIITGDLNDADLSIKMRGCEYLFHVAARYTLWQNEQDALYRDNVLGTRNVLAAAKQAGVTRVVYTSSVAAIGVNPNGKLTNETYQSSVEKLVGDYKKSKYYAEQEAIKAIKTGQDIVIVNPSSPIGAWDIKPTPTGDMIVRFLRQKMPVYVDTGLNLIDVRDVAKGHLLALKKGKTGERYILGNQNCTLKEILDQLSIITNIPAPQKSIPAWIPLGVAWVDETILTKFGKKPTVPIDGVRMSSQHMYYDAAKAVRELDLPQTNIDIALHDAVEWFNRYH